VGWGRKEWWMRGGAEWNKYPSQIILEPIYSKKSIFLGNVVSADVIDEQIVTIKICGKVHF
jgi:hypothetical protein